MAVGQITRLASPEVCGYSPNSPNRQREDDTDGMSSHRLSPLTAYYLHYDYTYKFTVSGSSSKESSVIVCHTYTHTFEFLKCDSVPRTRNAGLTSKSTHIVGQPIL